jgi:hypothetical protein
LIIPEFDGVDIRMFEVLPVDRWAQDDINAAPVCFPSWLVRPPAEQPVRNGQPTVVFLPEFIPGSSGGWIPVSPDKEKWREQTFLLSLEYTILIIAPG